MGWLYCDSCFLRSWLFIGHCILLSVSGGVKLFLLKRSVKNNSEVWGHSLTILLRKDTYTSECQHLITVIFSDHFPYTHNRNRNILRHIYQRHHNAKWGRESTWLPMLGLLLVIGQAGFSACVHHLCHRIVFAKSAY